MECIDEKYVRQLVEQENKTFKEISAILSINFPGERGYGIKSVQKFCESRGISRCVTQNTVEKLVADAVKKV